MDGVDVRRIVPEQGQYIAVSPGLARKAVVAGGIHQDVHLAHPQPQAQGDHLVHGSLQLGDGGGVEVVMALESMAVDGALCLQALKQGQDALQLGLVGGGVIIVVQGHALRGVLPGQGKGLVDKVLPHDPGPVAVPQLAACIVNGLVYHVKGDHQAGELRFQRFKHLADVVVQAGQQDLPGEIRAGSAVIFPEKGVGGLVVPDQDMAVDLDAVLPGVDKQGPGRIQFDCHSALVLPGQAGGCRDVQDVFGLQLVAVGHDAELAGVEVHQLAVDGLHPHDRVAKVKIGGVQRLEAGELRIQHGLFGQRRKALHLEAQPGGAQGFHVQDEAVILPGDEIPGQGGPDCPGHLLPDDVGVGFPAALFVGGGQDEAGAVGLVLVDQHLELIGLPGHQVKIPPGGMPVLAAAGDPDAALYNAQRSPAVGTGIPAVETAVKDGHIAHFLHGGAGKRQRQAQDQQRGDQLFHRRPHWALAMMACINSG